MPLPWRSVPFVGAFTRLSPALKLVTEHVDTPWRVTCGPEESVFRKSFSQFTHDQALFIGGKYLIRYSALSCWPSRHLPLLADRSKLWLMSTENSQRNAKFYVLLDKMLNIWANFLTIWRSIGNPSPHLDNISPNVSERMQRDEWPIHILMKRTLDEIHRGCPLIVWPRLFWLWDEHKTNEKLLSAVWGIGHLN